ncbi:hypothetical protein Tco_0812646, partial [Tanacetum coccineum]
HKTDPKDKKHDAPYFLDALAVARGACSQGRGCFSSVVAHIKAIRILIAITAFYDYEIFATWIVEWRRDWKSSKKNTTTMSATEAEYIAASEAAMEDV